ncbi:MAG: hypothetical protein AB7E55_22160 [Pigmentiphaga sp.]
MHDGKSWKPTRTNPFAILIQTQLLALRHRRAERMQPKLALVHRLLAEAD